MEWTSFIEPSERKSVKSLDEWPLEGKKWELPSIPKDSDGFVKSFASDDVEGFQTFFNDFGFVVIKQIITKSDVDNTLREIWDEIEGKNNVNARPLTTAEQLYLKGAQLEKEGNPLEAMECYRKAFRLQPDLENEDITGELVATNKPANVNRNDPRTWDSANWPTAQAVGFIGSNAAYGPQAWKNRMGENLYKVFSTLMNHKELWVSVDRYGIMRPTKNIPMGRLPECELRTSVALSDELKGTVDVVDKPEWKTISNWTHWDLNPWKWTLNKGEEGLPYVFEDFMMEDNGTKNEGIPKLQGIIALADTREQDGGFCLVPGFHKYLEEWSKLTRDTTYAKNQESKFGLVNVPEEDTLHSYLAKVPVRSGDLIVWRSEMPHCNFPNSSEQLRINQYVKMFPAKEGERGTDDRRLQVRRKLPKDVPLTDLGRKLFGLKSWKENT